MNLVEKLKVILAHNEKEMEKVEYDQSFAENLITFEDEKHGISTWNPFADGSGIYDVDPIEEYGYENLNSMVDKYEKKYGEII